MHSGSDPADSRASSVSGTAETPPASHAHAHPTSASKRPRLDEEGTAAESVHAVLVLVRTLEKERDDAQREAKEATELLARKHGDKSAEEKAKEAEAKERAMPLPAGVRLDLTATDVSTLAHNFTYEASSGRDGSINLHFASNHGSSAPVSTTQLAKEKVVRPGEKTVGTVLYGTHTGASVVLLGTDPSNGGRCICRTTRGHKVQVSAGGGEDDLLPDNWPKDKVVMLNPDQLGVPSAE